MAGRPHIDIWLTYYQDILDERLLADFHRLLSEEERVQQRRFYFADDRQRYLVTRALVRTTLSRYAPVEPTAWVFSKKRHGRPEIAREHVEATGLCFNVSHTRGLIALGVTRRCALGVDVENLASREVSLGIAERFFSPIEVAELAAVPPERRHDRFFEYWTFKESYIKARGMGLALPLDRFSFRYPDERSVRIEIDAELGDDPGRWGFWQFRPNPQYLLAVCCERPASEPATLTLYRTVPTVGDELLATPVLRSTEGCC